MIVDADGRTRRALRGRRIGKRRRVDAVSPHLSYVLCGKPGVWTPRLPLSGRQHCWLLIVCYALCCCKKVANGKFALSAQDEETITSKIACMEPRNADDTLLCALCGEDESADPDDDGIICDG